MITFKIWHIYINSYFPIRLWLTKLKHKSKTKQNYTENIFAPQTKVKTTALSICSYQIKQK